MQANLENVVMTLHSRFERFARLSHPSHMYGIARDLLDSLPTSLQQHQLLRLIALFESESGDPLSAQVLTAGVIMQLSDSEYETRWIDAMLFLLRADPSHPKDVVSSICFCVAQMMVAGRAALFMTFIESSFCGEDVGLSEEIAMETLTFCTEALSNGKQPMDFLWCNLKEWIVSLVLKSLSCVRADALLTAHLSRRVLIPLLLSSSPEALMTFQPRVQSLLFGLSSDRTKQGEVIVLIAALFEYLFRCKNRSVTQDYRCEAFLWDTIYTAFYDALTCDEEAGQRANMQLRAEYLVKRIVDLTHDQARIEGWTERFVFHKYFVWVPDVSNAQWELFFSVLEAINQYGVHIIHPALQKFDVIVEEMNNNAEKCRDTGNAMDFHPMWIELLLLKMLKHPNTAVRKLALRRLWSMRIPFLRCLSSEFIFTHMVATALDARLCVELDRNPLIASFLETKAFEGDEVATIPLTVLPLAEQIEHFYVSVFLYVLQTTATRKEALCRMLHYVTLRPSHHAAALLLRILHSVAVALESKTDPVIRDSIRQLLTDTDLLESMTVFVKDVTQDSVSQWLDVRLSAICFSLLVHLTRVDPSMVRECGPLWHLLCLCGPLGHSGGADLLEHVGVTGSTIDPFFLATQLRHLAGNNGMFFVRQFIQSSTLLDKVRHYIHSASNDTIKGKELFFLCGALDAGEVNDKEILASIAQEVSGSITSMARRAYCKTEGLLTTLIAFVEFHHALGTDACCRYFSIQVMLNIGEAIRMRVVGDLQKSAKNFTTINSSDEYTSEEWSLQHTDAWDAIVAAMVSVGQIILAHNSSIDTHAASTFGGAMNLSPLEHVGVLVKLLCEVIKDSSNVGAHTTLKHATRIILARNTVRLLQGILSGTLGTNGNPLVPIDSALETVITDWIRALMDCPVLRQVARDVPCVLTSASWSTVLAQTQRGIHCAILFFCTHINPQNCLDLVRAIGAFALETSEKCWESALAGVFDILAWAIAASKGTAVDVKESVRVMFDHLHHAAAREQARLALPTFSVLQYLNNWENSASMLPDESDSERLAYLAAVAASTAVLRDPLHQWASVRSTLLKYAVLHSVGRDDEGAEALVAITEPLLLDWPETLRAMYPPSVRLASVGRALAVSTLLRCCAEKSDWALDISLELMDWNTHHPIVSREPCMPNSRPHRCRVRLWQLLCALLPLVKKCLITHQKLMRRIVDDCLTRTNMGSVRRMMELYTMQLLERRPELYTFIDNALANYNLRPQVCGSYVLIAAHAVRRQLHSETAHVDELVPTLLRRLLQQSTSHQHLLRIICHIGLHHIHNEAGTQLRLSQEEESILEYIAEAPEHIKFRAKHDAFLFSDPMEACTPRQLYCVQRKEGNVVLHESLPAAAFERMRFVEQELNCLVGATTPLERLRVYMACKILDCQNLLEPFKYFPYIPHSTSVAQYYVDYTKEAAAVLAAATALADSNTVEEMHGGRSSTKSSAEENIQRKSTPWWSGQVYNELHPRALQATRQSLIVVGSLLQNPVNIAGLFRCGEIFAVSRIIVPDASVFDHPHFVAAARSAELWLPWGAVPAKDLAEYLSGMRRDGYTLVGVEQTAESVEMQSYNFPERSVIVLGAEGQGVPAPILPLLDACVEIPQYGLIRSLNVHVTGAIAMYEYTRQHLMMKKKE